MQDQEKTLQPTNIADPSYFHKVVDCQWACPAHTPVPEYIRLIAQGRYDDAYMVNWVSNVFPGVLGRTCDRPCEPACRRGRVEEGNGEKPAAGWYAGKQYDDDVEYAKTVLNDLNTYYPGAKSYEVAGFFFWQGEKDTGNATHAAHYEANLVRFIKSLRKDFNAPDAKFVLATLGEAKKGSGGNGGKILEAHLSVDGDSGKHPEFKGNVKTVYTNPLSKGGSGNGHYGSNSETYMNVGEGMGQAMVELLKSK